MRWRKEAASGYYDARLYFDASFLGAESSILTGTYAEPVRGQIFHFLPNVKWESHFAYRGGSVLRWALFRGLFVDRGDAPGLSNGADSGEQKFSLTLMPRG